MMKEDNISDNEIRIIGGSTTPTKSPFKWWIVVLAVATVVAIGLVWGLWPKTNDDVAGVFEQENIPELSYHLNDWSAMLDTIKRAPAKAISDLFVFDTIVNDIPLRMYVPLNSAPHLEIGYDVLTRKNDQILFFQAADVRGDNLQIVGAFVQKGKLVSQGMSKRGYCAIIDNIVTVGVADNSPLLEQAIEQNGDFFRQYPLVDRGSLVESELKNKSRRRALCDIGNQIAVVETQTKESMHDFAQALVDLGVNNAIYLVGGDAIGWSMDADGHGAEIGLWDKREYKNASFIVWPKK